MKTYKLFILLAVCYWIAPADASAQSEKPENKLLQTAVDAMLAYIYTTNSYDKPYIICLETLYDKGGLICEQKFTSDPTLKKVDSFKLSFNDGGSIFITYNSYRYDFFGKNRITGMDEKDNNGMTKTIRIDCDGDGKVNAIQMKEMYNQNIKIDKRIELTYDDKKQIVHSKDFKVNLLDKSCPSTLRSEQVISYLDNNGATITRTEYVGKQCDGTGRVHSVRTKTIIKTDEYAYKIVSDNVEQQYRYNDEGRLVYENYLPSNGNGWETLTEYEDGTKVKEDYRLTKNGKIYKRTVTQFLSEGNLIQYYDEQGEVCKEEQNFKSRKKVDGKWTAWTY